jgi:hypothetical protein
MNAVLIVIIAVTVLVALAIKIATLAVLGRWLLNKVPDEPDHSESVVSHH